MKLRVVILLAFCMSGCYSHLQYTEAIYDSSKPTGDALNTAEEVYADDSDEWQFNGINYYPYYKDYAQAGWFLLPAFNGSYSFWIYPSASFYTSLPSGSRGYDSGQPVGNSYFSNPILICWNPPVYSSSGYRPSGIHINVGVGIINDGRIKKSGSSNHGPRTVGPNRVSGSNISPDRTRGTNITRGQRSTAGRSSALSTRNRSRGN